MIDLFSSKTAQTGNLLPYDGSVVYSPAVFSPQKSMGLLSSILSEQNLVRDEVIVFGKKHIMNRLTVLVGDKNFEYGYSKIKRVAEPWGLALSEVKSLVEAYLQTKFNCCLVNYYPSGEDGMGWHSDDERELGENPAIASVSLGCERKFSFKHKTKKAKIDLLLQNGSVLFMSGCTQHYWKHALPKSKKILKPRMNLTFRTIY